MTTHRSNQAGFTLIELVIVIVVLGILAAILMFGVGTVRQDAKDACNTASAQTLRTAQLAYEVKTGTANASLATLKSAGYLEGSGTC